MSKVKNIMLPVDGSQQSIDAFKRGIEYASEVNSSVYLVQVLKEGHENLPKPERESFLKSLSEYAENHGVTVNKLLVYGEARSQIATILVDEWSIDLIIMGATGKGRVGKMVIGSTTDYVIRHARCDVLIVR